MRFSTRRAAVGVAVLCAIAPGFVRAADAAHAAENAPDLALAVQAPVAASVGEEIPFSFTVTNVGTATADGPVRVVFTLFSTSSPGIESVSGQDWNCFPTFANETCEHPGPVFSGGSLPTIFANTHAPTDGGDVEILGGVGPFVGDDNPANDNVDVTTTTTSPVDLTVTLTPPALNATANAPVAFTADVQNVGTDPATGSITVQTSGTGLTDLAGSGTGWLCSGAFLTCTHAGPLAAGQHLPALEFTATVAPVAFAELDSQVIHPDDHKPSNDFGVGSVVVTGGPDLKVELALDGPILPGQSASYVANVENVGGADTTEEIVLSLDGLEGTTGAGDGWTCDTFSFHIRCATPGPLQPGTPLPPITFTGAFASSPVTVHARVSTTGDLHPDNNEVEITTPVQAPDLAISVDDHGATALVGSTIDYDVTTTNEGPVATAGPVTVSYALFGTETTVTATGTGWTCDDDARTCTNSDTFAAGATLPALNVHVELGVTFTGELDAHFFVESTLDYNADNDEVNITTPVSAPVDLAPTIDASAAPTAFDESGTYVVEVHNLGTAASTGEVAVSVAGSSLKVTDAQGPGWNCTVANPTECTRADAVPAGGAVPPITVTATVTQFTQSSTTFFASTTNASDGRGDNNDISVDTDVASPADLATSVTDHGATFIAGRTGTYDVDVANTGTATQTGPVSVHLSPGTSGIPTLAKSAGATIANAFGAGWDCGEDGLGWTCTRADALAAGAAFPGITVVVDVPNDTQMTFSVNTSTDDDGNLANNSDLETTPIQATPDLVISAATSATFFTVGQPASATVTVKNARAVDADGTVTVTLTTWDGVADATASGTGWDCQPIDASDIECTTPGPVAGNTTMPVITVTGTAVPTFDGTTTLFAQVANQSDGDTTNNFASLESQVAAPVDLTLHLDGPDSSKVKQPLTVAAIVHNAGTATDHGQISIELDVSAFSATDITAGGLGWSCAPDGAGFQQLCNYDGLLAAGEDLTALELTLTPNLVGDVFVSAAVASPADGKLSNNLASKTIWVTGTPTNTTSSTIYAPTTTSTSPPTSTTTTEPTTSTTATSTSTSTSTSTTTTTTVPETSTTNTTEEPTTTTSTTEATTSTTATSTSTSTTTTTTPDEESTTSTTIESVIEGSTTTTSSTIVGSTTTPTTLIDDHTAGGGSGSGDLPFTGSSSGNLVWFALVAIVIGLSLSARRSFGRR